MRHARLAACLVALTLVVAVGALLVGHGDASRRAASSAPPHLPTVVNAPGAWSDDEGTHGPVAALGLGLRTVPVGVQGERQSIEVFAVSADDGRATWVDLPAIALDDAGFIGTFAVSPDGRWIGWSRHESLQVQLAGGRQVRRVPLLGWAVMDTTTGETRELADPAARHLRDSYSDLALSGDSRYLLTSYEARREPRTRGHRFVAWDVEDGTPTVLEAPGRYWAPTLGSAPSGVVWARGATVHRAQPGAGAPALYVLPHRVEGASWSPDGTAFAYLGLVDRKGHSRLYAGPSPATARPVTLPASVDAAQLLGWVDARHLVVGHYRDDVAVVDLATGSVESVAMRGYGDRLAVPLLAADLWQQPLGEPEAPRGLHDPRNPWRGAAVVLAVLLAAGAVAQRRRLTGARTRL